jgi:branched-subunit amino acid ABC-type transport system permease component
LDVVLQLLVNGLAVGCIYGLLELGFVLIYKTTELVNLAQGDLISILAIFEGHRGRRTRYIGSFVAISRASSSVSFIRSKLPKVRQRPSVLDQ